MPTPASDRQRAELTADERQELQEAFQLFDQEATGRIDLHELKVIDACHLSLSLSAPHAPVLTPVFLPSIIKQVLMRALGFQVKRAQVMKMAHEVDPNHGGAVDFETYLEISE